MTTLTFGVIPQDVFLADLTWSTEVLGNGERPLGSAHPVYHRPSPGAGESVTIELLSPYFLTLKNIAQRYRLGEIATLAEPAISLNLKHRATGIVSITGERIGGHVRFWRLTVQAVQQP